MKYRFETECQATIRELWEVDLDRKPTEDELQHIFDHEGPIIFIRDRTLGDEEERRIVIDSLMEAE